MNSKQLQQYNTVIKIKLHYKNLVVQDLIMKIITLNSDVVSSHKCEIMVWQRDRRHHSSNSPLSYIIDKVKHYQRVGETFLAKIEIFYLINRSFYCENARVFIPGGLSLAGFYLTVPVGQTFVVIRKQQNLTSCILQNVMSYICVTLSALTSMSIVLRSSPGKQIFICTNKIENVFSD